jgi:uncharacterized membrane protein
VSVAQALKIYEQIGLPILVAGVSAYALWFCLKWVLVKFSSDFTRQLTEIAAEIDEEQREARQQITEVKTILIRLVDRTRLLGEELNAHDQVARAVWGLNDRVERPRTQSEIRDDLLERLRHVPEKNGGD